MSRILGVCSCCGGAVVAQNNPALRPVCHGCGAVAATHAPVFDMVRQAPVVPVYIPKVKEAA